VCVPWFGVEVVVVVVGGAVLAVVLVLFVRLTGAFTSLEQLVKKLRQTANKKPQVNVFFIALNLKFIQCFFIEHEYCKAGCQVLKNSVANGVLLLLLYNSIGNIQKIAGDLCVLKYLMYEAIDSIFY
jgi:hypothetical protein